MSASDDKEEYYVLFDPIDRVYYQRPPSPRACVSLFRWTPYFLGALLFQSEYAVDFCKADLLTHTTGEEYTYQEHARVLRSVIRKVTVE